jgi:hypothetical protein
MRTIHRQSISSTQSRILAPPDHLIPDSDRAATPAP